MLPIPTHLRDILMVDEENFDGHNMDGRLQCTCGCDDIRLKIYGEQHTEHIAVKRYKDDYGLRITGACAACGKGFEIFDMARHGYNGFVCHDGIPVEDADLKVFSCGVCQGDTFAVDIGIELEDKEQFIEEVVEDEPDKFVPEDYVDAFDWFTVALKCKKCGRKYEDWVNFETS